MNAWKKIASLCGLSLASALSVVACAADVEEPSQPVDTAAEFTAAPAPEEAPLAASLDRDDHDSHCERKCKKEYRMCMKHADSWYEKEHCSKEYMRCMHHCDHGH